MSLIATLLVIRFVLPHPRRALVGLAIAGVSGEGLFLLLHAANYSLDITFPVQLAPLLVSAYGALFLLIILGPLANSSGMLYQSAFYTMEGRSARQGALVLPGLQLLSALLSRRRTLTGALLYKGLLNQSRSVFTWGRAAILVICVALFPILQKAMLSYGFSSLARVGVYSSLVAILTVVEYAAYAINSEGARISYYLLAPFDIARYLRARLVSFLLTILSIGLAVDLVLSWWQYLSLYDAALAALLMALLLTGYTSCIVLGSAFDLDRDQVAEGAMQTLMLEELPVTPRRLQVLGLSLLLLAGMVLLILKLPAAMAGVVLMLLDGALCIGLGLVSLVHLRKLVL